MIDVRACHPDEVRHVLAAADTERTNPDGVYSLEQIIREGTCFKLTEAGRIVGAYVLQPFGAELWITAAAGTASVDLTKVVAAAVAHQGQEFDALVFNTVRPGLIKKALALGYTCTMRKRLK